MFLVTQARRNAGAAFKSTDKHHSMYLRAQTPAGCQLPDIIVYRLHLVCLLYLTNKQIITYMSDTLPPTMQAARVVTPGTQ